MKYTYKNMTDRRLTVFFKDESFFMHSLEEHVFTGKVEIKGLELMNEEKIETHKIMEDD